MCAMKRLILECSLKPFRDHSEEGIRSVCREMLRQWAPLWHDAEQLSFLLWTADGSEILDYSGRREDEIEWACWIGVANGPWSDDPKTLHTWRWPYCENPPRLTYERLGLIVRILKNEGEALTGRAVTIGTIFDPGPEFAESTFKYKRHQEISAGNTMGQGKWVSCAATLRADDRSYAGFPAGVPEDITLGTFLGRQSQHFLTDLGFDYIWFSNGFGFALAAWNVTGEVFDGRSFDTTETSRVREAILRFWQDFRRECPRFPIETRGSNLSAGMDLAAHASPLRDIYRGGFDMIAPVNSPWAALNGDYGLELIGWLSHIAELPENGTVPFRFYIHDPWWANSPWIDRYGREPNDIYLPLSACRIAADGAVTRPDSVSLLTIDDSCGRMPDLVPTEVTPHIQQALRDFPDAPGLVTWIYPFDEYHDWTFGQSRRVDEVFFGDWFMRGAVNQGFPLNTVVSVGNFLSARKSSPSLFNPTILVCPAPDAGSELAGTLLDHIDKGGQALLYGPLRRTDPKVLELLELSIGSPISDSLELQTSLTPDRLEKGGFPNKLHMRALISGGGAEEIANSESPGRELLAEVIAGSERRAFAVARRAGQNGGRIGWVRGALSEEVSNEAMLPKKIDPQCWYHSERLMRFVLEEFGYIIRFIKPGVETPDPVILAARSRNGVYFSGFTPSTNARLQWRFPDGVPIPVGCDVTIEREGTGTMSLARAWHRECRVFVEQREPGEVSCREKLAGAVDVKRRLIVTGLIDATVTFFRDTSSGSQVRFQEEPPYLGTGRNIPVLSPSPDRTLAHGVTGTMIISW